MSLPRRTKAWHDAPCLQTGTLETEAEVAMSSRLAISLRPPLTMSLLIKNNQTGEGNQNKRKNNLGQLTNVLHLQF